ncbi:MAG: ComF family protein [candidate division WOR-3 bacterium]
MNLLRSVLDIFYPRFCYVCQIPSYGLLCQRCEGKVEELRSFKTLFLFDSHIEKVFSLYEYRDEISTLLQIFKYECRWEVAEYLLSLVSIHLGNYDFIVPVPLHHVRFRERGGNQSEIVAKHISKISGIPMVKKGIIRTRYTRKQVELSRDERLQNVKGAFRVLNPERFKGKRVLLVDDVYTTGATLENLAKAFKGFPDLIDGFVLASSKI